MESTRLPLVLLIMLILVGIIFIYTIYVAQPSPYIGSFEECVKAGNPIQGNNDKPRSCTTDSGVEFKETTSYRKEQ